MKPILELCSVTPGAPLSLAYPEHEAVAFMERYNQAIPPFDVPATKVWERVMKVLRTTYEQRDIRSSTALSHEPKEPTLATPSPARPEPGGLEKIDVFARRAFS